MSSEQKVFIHDYTERAIAVFGNTKPYISDITNIGGKFNQNLKYNGSTSPGWIFPRTKYQTVKQLVDNINDGKVQAKEYEKKEYVKKEEKKETKVVSTENTVVLKKEEFMFIMNTLARLEKEVNDLKVKVYGEDKSKITAYMKQNQKKQETKEESEESEDIDDEDDCDGDDSDKEEYEVLKSASGRGPCLIKRKK
jgi:hypothetical protein